MRRRTQTALPLLVFAIAFTLVAAAARDRFAPPEDGGLGPKFRFLQRHADEFDLIVFGSSVVRHGVVPARLDPALAAAGTPARSFNFGIDGMSMFELDHWFRRVLDLQPAKLEWAVIELGSWEPLRPHHRNFASLRSTLWHNPRQTGSVLSWLWSRELPAALASERRGVAASHVELAANRFGNLGSAQPWIAATFDEPGRHSGEVTLDELAQTRGYRLPPRGGPMRGDRARYDELVAALSAPPPAPRGEVERVCELVRLLEARGIVPVFVVTPTVVRGRHPLAQADPDGCIAHLLDYQDPARYPELFDPAARFDFDHLNAPGAELFTALLARDLQAILREPAAR